MNSLFLKKKNEKGQGLVEYALILVLVGIVVIAVLVMLGPSIANVFGRVNSSVATTGPVNSGVVAASTQTQVAPPTSTPVVTNLPNGAVCTVDSQCNSVRCNNGHCVGKPVNSACSANSECDSNKCAGGKCK